jgi:hypothetical protein
MNSIKKFMTYKRVKDLAFDWQYEELMELPLYMIYHIYQVLDEFLEEDKKRYQALANQQATQR